MAKQGTTKMNRSIIFALTVAGLSLLAGDALMPRLAHGDIFVTNSYNGTIGEYTMSGAVVNASLISGLSKPESLVVSGPNLYGANYGKSGSIGEYTLGATPGTIASSSPALISGLSYPSGIAVSGSSLFVTNSSSKISEYDAITGATMNASLATLPSPTALAISGSDLFVLYGGNTIGVLTTSGVAVNGSLISGLSGASGIALSGSNLYVASYFGGGKVGEYNAITGETVNDSLITPPNSWVWSVAVAGSNFFIPTGGGSIGKYTTSGATVNDYFITGLNSPYGIAVTADVPEPASLGVLALGGVVLLMCRRKGSR